MNLKYKKMLEDLGEACIDWFEDIGDCHFCATDNYGNHDPDVDCPVAIAIYERDSHQPDIIKTVNKSRLELIMNPNKDIKPLATTFDDGQTVDVMIRSYPSSTGLVKVESIVSGKIFVRHKSRLNPTNKEAVDILNVNKD